MCLLASATGLNCRGMPVDILAQIGFVVLVGLAAKNAILIVEFARQRQDHNGDEPEEAAITAARTRLRPSRLAGATGNRKFVDSPLEERVSSEPVSETAISK